MSSESKQWHLDYLIRKYEQNKDAQGYPFYLACDDYFKEEEGPEISDLEHAEVMQEFCDYVIKGAR